MHCFFQIKLTEDKNRKNIEEQIKFKEHFIELEVKEKEYNILKKDMIEKNVLLDNFHKNENELSLTLEEKEKELNSLKIDFQEFKRKFDQLNERLKIKEASMIVDDAEKEKEKEREKEIILLMTTIEEIESKNVLQLKEQEDIIIKLKNDLIELKEENKEKEKIAIENQEINKDLVKREIDEEKRRENEKIKTDKEKNKINQQIETVKNENINYLNNLKLERDDENKKNRIILEGKDKEINDLTATSSNFEKKLIIAQDEIKK